MNPIPKDGPAAQQGVINEINLLIAEVAHQRRRMAEIESGISRFATSGVPERLRADLATIADGYRQLALINSGSERDVRALLKGGE